MTQELFSKIQNLIAAHNVMLFMKGSPEQPMCGFSGLVVQILNRMGVPFGSFDVLSDEGMRQAIKDFSDWPTIPQLYVKGEFIGGSDITRDMYTSGQLQALFEKQGIRTS